MQAIRRIRNIETDKLVINIPRYFKEKRVEVIILPIDRSNHDLEGSESKLSRAAEDFLSLGGSECWEGNLDEMREQRNGTY